MYSFRFCIDTSTLANPLSTSFLDTYTVCLRHLWDVRPYTPSWVFLFSSSFTEVLPSSTSEMVPSIWCRGQPSCLSLWKNFCNVVCFRVVSSFSWDNFLIFSFISPCLWCPLPIFPSTFKFPFLRTFWSFLGLIVLFLPSCVVSCFSLLAKHIFPCWIPSLCPHCLN